VGQVRWLDIDGFAYHPTFVPTPPTTDGARRSWHDTSLVDRASPLCRRYPPWLIALAAVGGTLLLVDAAFRWSTPSDEHAYWLAGRNLIDGRSVYALARLGPIQPYAYHYPPPFAQLVAPIAAVVPAEVWTAAWTVLLLACLLWLAGRDPIIALASVAFLPVAVELWFRNIHLPLAVLTYLGLRRWPVLLGIGMLVKVSPGLGLLYLAAKGQLRGATLGVAVAASIVAVSAALGPNLWAEFLDVTLARGPLDVSGFLPLPYALRLAAGVITVLLAARLRAPWNDGVAIVGMTIALPTLWFTALSFLVAALPSLREAGWARSGD
jgi:hypothetical protein